MSHATHVEQLRASARHLRSVSTTLGASRGLTVHSLAGPDTWIGPTAQACEDAMLTLRRQLQSGQQSLSDAARRLERRADALEAQQPPVVLVS